VLCGLVVIMKRGLCLVWCVLQCFWDLIFIGVSGVYLVGCGLYVGVWLTWSVSVSAVLLVLRCLCCVV